MLTDYISSQREALTEREKKLEVISVLLSETALSLETMLSCSILKIKGDSSFKVITEPFLSEPVSQACVLARKVCINVTPPVVDLVPAGVQAETGPRDPGEEGAQVPHPESARPLPPA